MTKAEFVRRLQSSPALHIERIQGVETLTAYQKEICKAIAENDYIVIKACHDVGKTFLCGKLVLWFGSVFRRSKIITTAPSWPQVELLLWSEIRAGFANSRIPLGGRMLTTEWKIDDDWFAVGMSPKEDADDSSGGQGKTSGFQGFHAPYIFIIFDEATGISLKRWIQAQGMLTSGRVKFVAIGNPTSKNSEFANCFKSRLYKKITISCFDSPNLIENGITDLEKLKAEVATVKELSDDAARERIRGYKIVQPSLLTLGWVVERAIVWGFDHALFQSKCLGEFPDEDDSTLISLGVVEQSQARPDAKSLGQSIGVGVDVARYGEDESVITSIWGKTALKPKVKAKKDVMEISGATVNEIQELIRMGADPSLINVGVDCTGLGAGVYDALKEAQRNGAFPSSVGIHEVHFGQGFGYLGDSDSAKREREELEKQYTNRKGKIFVELAADMKSDLAISNEAIYQEELPTLLVKFDSRGRYVMESKEDYKERTGRKSPDHADSLAIANEMRKMKSNQVGVIRIV